MELTREMIQAARFASPLATAIALSANDPVPYRTAAHIKLMSDAIVEAVYSGVGRLIITCPPRHSKSWLVSKWTPVWYLAKFPHKQVMNCGYGSEFAKKWGRAVRNVIQQHQDVLPFSIASDSQAANIWKTDKEGGVLTAGVGGGITGEGADLLIIDDPIKNWKEASSFPYREGVWEWYTSTARTRLHPGGTIIVVQTRWNEDDLAGRLIKHADEEWKVVNLPAIYDEYNASLGPCPLGRKIGEPLWPERYGIKELEVFMQQDKMVWESLYQQRPGTVAGLGNVYHAFDEAVHVRELDRDHSQKMFWSLDFNVNPMCSVLGQYREYFGPLSSLTNEKYVQIGVLDEICLPESHTAEACEEFYNRLVEINGTQPCVLEVYGDASGDSRHSSQTSGSDWDIVRKFLKSKPEITVNMRVKRKNPGIKDRINAVNAKLKNQLGEIGTHVAPRCKQLVRDWKNVKWKLDASGNTTGQLDKSQADLTHVSDAYGYFVETKFGRGQTTGEQTGVMQ